MDERMKPAIAFITWNRLGNTVRNLELLLNTTEDFDLFIVDNNSSDDTRRYLRPILDPRIKEIKFFPHNYGIVYAVNYVISKRMFNQPVMNVENDVSIYTPDFIHNCERIIREFPEVGVLANARGSYFHEKKIEYTDMIRNRVLFRKTEGLIGNNLYFTSKVLDILGYLNEETCYADLGIPVRVKAAGMWVGFNISNYLEQKQFGCPCPNRATCRDPKDHYCFKPYIDGYKHGEFAKIIKSNFPNYVKNISDDDIYCGSIHDPSSQKNYDKDKAMKNFEFFDG